MTDEEAIAHLIESCRRIDETTSRMTDEEYAKVKAEIEDLQDLINAIVEAAKE